MQATADPATNAGPGLPGRIAGPAGCQWPSGSARLSVGFGVGPAVIR